MKYLSIESVLQSFIDCKGKTQNKFWGMISIIIVIGEKIIPATNYSFSVEEVQDFLEDLFRLEDDKKQYSTTNRWSILFSKQWIENVPELMLASKPNIFSVASWCFRRKSFDDDITSEQIVGKFLDLLHLTKEEAQKWFIFNPESYTFNSSLYKEKDLLDLISQKLGILESNKTLSFEGLTFIKSNPGSLGQAPFIQTLYANQGIQKCLILTQFDFQELYPMSNNTNNQADRMNSSLQQFVYGLNSAYRPYITAIKSKPFLLLAGISGTGKSRVVRELARACWDVDSEEYQAQKPKNFEMVQVKPNWHDSSELIGYVSRVSGQPVFVAGDFLKFVARAWEDSNVPYFLCLDEMNLAPVEQYFAEYLSVVESRKADPEGNITTDPILKKSKEDWYRVLTSELTNNDDVRNRFLEDGICIPQNLIIVGTVNMDETTFSFSRKVLDRAMTIEMNKVDLNGGLTTKYEQIGKLGYEELIGKAVEGVDVYSSYKNVCDTAIAYLLKINEKLDGTPFKVAYRTRNEVLLYVINNLPYNKIEGDDESTYLESFVVARALDEITNMKILSRIEGDESKVSEEFLNELSDTIKKGLEDVFEGLFDEDDDEVYKSVSLAKIEEMKGRLESGYTSFWS